MILLPAVGAILEIATVFARKPLFGYKVAIAGLLGIAGLSIIVWAHHMFTTGWAPRSAAPSCSRPSSSRFRRVIIFLSLSAPSGEGNIWMRLPMMWVFGVICNFIIGASPASTSPTSRWTTRCTARCSSSRTSTTFSWVASSGRDRRRDLLVPEGYGPIHQREDRAGCILDDLHRGPDHLPRDVRIRTGRACLGASRATRAVRDTNFISTIRWLHPHGGDARRVLRDPLRWSSGEGRVPTRGTRRPWSGWSRPRAARELRRPPGHHGDPYGYGEESEFNSIGEETSGQ